LANAHSVVTQPIAGQRQNNPNSAAFSKRTKNSKQNEPNSNWQPQHWEEATTHSGRRCVDDDAQETRWHAWHVSRTGSDQHRNPV